MKTESYTNKQIDDFMNRADFSLVHEIHKEQARPKELTFAEFLHKYQKKHLQKYGHSLPLKVE